MAHKPKNLLFLFTDQHSKFITGCYGNPYVETPNLDRLAARGVRFSTPPSTAPATSSSPRP